MADDVTIAHFIDLLAQGHHPTVGAWVQVDPANELTTVFNAFNTLGPQQMELHFIGPDGFSVAAPVTYTLAPFKTLRIDLETLLPSTALPFEGNLWVWCKGDATGGTLGLQAIDLDFINRSRPAGHVMASVHVIYDFFDTGSVGPFLDLVSPRVLVDETAEGAPRYANYVGLAQIPINSLDSAEVELTLTNEDGQDMTANRTIVIPPLGSWFGQLAPLFPDIANFLQRPGELRGYGTLTVRERTDRRVGMAVMTKVVDLVSGEMLVNHMSDRSFARPAQKEAV